MLTIGEENMVRSAIRQLERIADEKALNNALLKEQNAILKELVKTLNHSFNEEEFEELIKYQNEERRKRLQ